ncbi:MAG: hypothetical protein M1334_00645, partial [Patescibacteria group bacterium]|nr:hypothetical protein [Patescibacteria group bacterium]
MPVKLSKKQIIIIGGGLAAVIIIVLAFMFGGSAGQQAAAPESLTIWGDTQNKDVWSQIISDYQALRPNVSIKYQNF